MVMRTINFALLLTTLSFSAFAHPHNDNSAYGQHNHNSGWVHENGIGPDPDNDSNPATITDVIPFIGEVLVNSDGEKFPIIHFEPPPGTHGEPIRVDYEASHGVTFGPGLSWQICEGQRHFQYNSMCTYEAPTSGNFAAGYLNYLNRPLIIEFDKAVCLASMSIYPTGAVKNEPFLFTVEGWDDDNQLIATASKEFHWNKDTVRFKNLAGAYFASTPAKKISVSLKSLDPLQAGKTLRYLIDDLSFARGDCTDAVAVVEKRLGDKIVVIETPITGNVE